VPTNPIVNRYGTSTETNILDDMMTEAIQHSGVDVLYLPRVQENLDMVTLEDPLVRFEKAHEIAAYINNHEAFRGDGHFMDKIGVHIKDQIFLKISALEFQEQLRGYGLKRPREGDLIYIPMLDRGLFEVMFVDKWADFYPIGHLPSIDVRCEYFEYSGQRFATGIEAIDKVMGLMDTNDADTSLPTVDPIADNLDDAGRLQTEANTYIDFSEDDPYSEGLY
jgi:hypothetical protein